MLKKTILLLLSLAFLPDGCVAIARAEGMTVKQVTDLLDGALQTVKSFDIRVNCSTSILLKTVGKEVISPGKKEFVIEKKRKLLSGEKPTVMTDSLRQVFQRGKGRIEFLGKNTSQPTMVTVYDGEMTRSFDSANRSMLIRNAWVDRIANAEGWDYLQSWRNIDGRLSLLNCLKERKNFTIKAGGRDEPFITLESNPYPKPDVTYSVFGYRVTLDKRHGLMPIAIERIREVEGKLLTQKETRVTEWKDLGGGVWVPVKAVTRYFDPDPKWETFGELAVEDVLVVDVDRSTWNKEIPEDTFNLALPAGTKVTDTLREVQLITGQPDPGKNLDDLAGHAKKIVPYPVPHPPAVKSSPLWPWIVGGGFVGVAAVVALYYKFFYARKRQTGQIP